MNDATRPNIGEILGGVAYWLMLVACIFMPWLLHFAVGWWAAYPAFFALVALYDWLFVPKGSICMGIPFGLVLGSCIAMVMLDAMLLVRGFLHR